MKYGSLVIEKKEYVLLKRLMNLAAYYKDKTLRTSVEKLVGEMESAQIYDEANMPEDVIRLNATITIVSNGGWQKEFKLVMPTDGDFKNGKISILTTMGAGVMGYSEGDTLIWEFPSGEQQLTIKKVEQETARIYVNMVL